MELGPLIGKGRTAETYRYGNDKVVKLFIEGFPEFLIENEYEAHMIAQNHIPNVPTIHNKTIHEGRIGLIYDYVPGPILSNMMLANIRQIASLTADFAQLQASINSVKTNGLISQKEFFRNTISEVSVLDESKRTTIIERLETLPEGNSLCHFDYHFENIIYCPEGMMVIDWMNAVQGCPEADAARTRYILRSSVLPNQTSFFQRSFIRLIRRWIARKYEKKYCEVTGCSQEDIEKWELMILASRLGENIPKEHSFLLNRIDKLLT